MREIAAGLGYSAYNLLGEFSRSNDASKTVEGENSVLIQQTSRFLVKNLFGLKNGKGNKFESTKFLIEDFDFDQYTKSETSGHVQSGKCLKKALEARANYLVHGGFNKIQALFQSKGSQEDAWNFSLPFNTIPAAKAYGQLFIYNNFEKVSGQKTDGPTREVMKMIGELFALLSLNEDAATMLEFGYFRRDDINEVRDRILELFGKLKDEIMGLVDAISTPYALLPSPIGAEDGDIYNRYIKEVYSAEKCFDRPTYWS